LLYNDKEARIGLLLDEDKTMEQLDFQKIADELEFDLEDVEMLIEVFIESALESLALLEHGIKNKDFKEIYESAHAIKGSSANLTLMEISNLAKNIESSAREAIEVDYEHLYTDLAGLVNGIR